MLNEEQLAVLPVRASVQADVARMVLSGGIYGDKDLASEISYMAGELATALLARQRDRQRLRRVLAKAKLWKNGYLSWKRAAEWYVFQDGKSLMEYANKHRWSAAWKAAAKKWRAAFNIRRDALVALSKERDGLAARLASAQQRIAELQAVLKKCKRLAYQYRRGGLQPLLDEINEVLDES